MPRGKVRCISDTAPEINLITITWKRVTWAFWKYKTKEFNKFLIIWGYTEYFIFNNKQISFLQSDLETAQLPGSDSGGSLLSQLNQSDCFISSSNPQETCISNEPQQKPRALSKSQALQKGKRNKFFLAIPDIAIGKHCGKGTRYFQMEKPLIRTESGPGTCTDQNQSERVTLEPVSLLQGRNEPSCAMRSETQGAAVSPWGQIRNTGSISELLGTDQKHLEHQWAPGDSKPFQATEDSKKKKRWVRKGQPDSPFITCWHWDRPKGLQKGTQTPTVAALQQHKNLCAAHGAEEAKRSRVLVPETSYMQGQKQETEVNETEEDYPLSPRVHG